MIGRDLVVIAEAGVNHVGDVERALEMVSAAAEAGADYVKFQLFETDRLIARGTATAAYQAAATGEADQRELLRDLELGLDAFQELAALCRARRIGFLCTAFEESALDALISFGMDSIKVASGELTNTPALTRIAGYGLRVFLSTGMATLDEVATAIDTLRTGGAADILPLQCTSLYPAPAEALNLRAMVAMADRFGLPVGFSDHSLGDHASIAAVALGAVVIEKHFTLDRRLPGPDHLASLEPDELAAMIRKLREVRLALGDGRKRPTAEEAETAAKVRRSWHAARDLRAGEVIGSGDVTLKRPADGLAPHCAPAGRVLLRAVRADEPILAEHLGEAAWAG